MLDVSTHICVLCVQELFSDYGPLFWKAAGPNIKTVLPLYARRHPRKLQQQRLPRLGVPQAEESVEPVREGTDGESSDDSAEGDDSDEGDESNSSSSSSEEEPAAKRQRRQLTTHKHTHTRSACLSSSCSIVCSCLHNTRSHTMPRSHIFKSPSIDFFH